jgi:UDP-glucose 4-epimerase
VRVLVTGGAGFIGSHIVDALLEQGHKVAVVDNLSTGSRENVNHGARFYNLNICDAQLADIFEQERPDMVNHQAAQTVVTQSLSDPAFDAQTNILGSLNVILNCISFKVKRVIYASSGGAIYGEPQYLPVDENHPVNPISPYGISKCTVEHYLRLYSLQGNLEYVALRYPNVYGPRQNPGGEAGVVAIFTRQMLNGEPVTIFGSGNKTRDYVHVSDVASANLLAMERGRNEIYNISSGLETSDHQMFDTLAKLLCYQRQPVFTKERPGEIHRICLDATRASVGLGWQPRVSFGEGLKTTAAYYKNRLLKTSGSR